jgi:trk system potassium uptake protein TrkA
MHIVIVGGGVVGFSLAEQLLADKHQLSLVETDPELCQQLSEKLDLQIVNGSGTSPSVLSQAGLRGADMVLAVTPSNEVNILVCAIAAQYDVKRRIARLRGDEYRSDSGLIDLEQLGITTVIQPEKTLVDHILQYVDTPHALEAANFENGRILMRGYRVTENMEIANKTPREIRETIMPLVVLFSAIVRDGLGMIPDGETKILPGDIVYSLFPRESLERFLKLVGIESKNRKVIITGDSYATVQLAMALDKTDNHVIYVDTNREHAEQVAGQLDHIEVLHGDCTQNDLLRELNVDKASFFIATSEEADYNMLSSLLAKAEGVHEVVATTIELHHGKLFKSIGIDHIVNPRLTTAREIMEIISRGHIGGKFKLSDVEIEAVRFTVDPDSDVAGIRVQKIATKLKKGTIIGIIVREDRLIVPGGDTVIEAGDHVIIITLMKNLPYLSKLFKPHRFLKRS